MVWFTQPQQIADKGGNPTGRWRMTATSDEGGGGPFGDTSHDHPSAKEAQECERCDEYIARVTGFPSKARRAEDERKPVAWACELAQANRTKGDGPTEWFNWQPSLTWHKPEVPEGSIRNLRPLYDLAPSPGEQ